MDKRKHYYMEDVKHLTAMTDSELKEFELQVLDWHNSDQPTLAAIHNEQGKRQGRKAIKIMLLTLAVATATLIATIAGFFYN